MTEHVGMLATELRAPPLNEVKGLDGRCDAHLVTVLRLSLRRSSHFQHLDRSKVIKRLLQPGVK
jgi:hypothetical protein